jgi:hypothetical protein
MYKLLQALAYNSSISKFDKRAKVNRPGATATIRAAVLQVSHKLTHEVMIGTSRAKHTARIIL